MPMAASRGGPIRGLDHATLVVEALDSAVTAYETLFDRPCDARGSAEGLDWARFAVANTALVLVAPREAASPFLAPLPAGVRAAFGAVAFAVEDPAAAARLLERRGLPAAAPALPWLDGTATPLLPAEIGAIDEVIARVARTGRRYRCAACGFEAQHHHWQCPGCLGWDTYPPQRLEEQ
jgi:hypothetical protein